MLKIYTNQDTSNCHRDLFMAEDETEMLASNILDCVTGNDLPEAVSESTVWEILEDWAMSSIQDYGFAVHKKSMLKYLDDLCYSSDAPLDGILACLIYAEWRRFYLNCAWKYGESQSPHFRKTLCGDLPGGEMHLVNPPIFLNASWSPDWACLQPLHERTVTLADAIKQDLMNPASQASSYEYFIKQSQDLFCEWLHYAVYLGTVTMNGPMLAVACNKLVLTNDIQPSELMMLIAFFRYWESKAMVETMEPPEKKMIFGKKRDHRLQQRCLLAASKSISGPYCS